MKRFLTGLLAFLLLAGLAFSDRNDTTTALEFCTPKPNLMQRWTMLSSRIGSVVPALSKPLPTEQFAENIAGAWWTLGYQLGVTGAAADGHPAPDPIIAPIDCSNLCLTGQAADPQSDRPASTLAGLTGPALAADALHKAGFPADEIPTFVAIAKHESGFRNITGPTVGAGTMRGMWQLNDQYWHLDNWADPYANAVMAKRVRDEAVANGNSPYGPWSTRQAAMRDAGDYARYGARALASAGGGGVVAAAAVAPAPSTPQAQQNQGQDSFTLADPCVASAGSGGLSGVTVGSWNTAGKIGNSPARINASAGFADLVGLQEISHNSALKPPGYGVTPGRMAVPIIWKKSTLALVTWKREDSLTFGHTPKSVVWGVWQVKATGQRFAAINTHQLVEGGRGWDIQAANVSKVRKRLSAQGLPVVLVGDMNASLPKARAAFGGTGVGHHIDFVFGFGADPVRQETLSYAGSDHARVRAAFAAEAPTSGTVPGGTVRTVTSQGKTYRIPIPAGPAGVAIDYALDQLGKPYVWGSSGPNGFDCSGLVSAAWRKAGINMIPQTSPIRHNLPEATGTDMPGDLWGHGDVNPAHVVMFVGQIDGKPTIVEAPRTGVPVRISQATMRVEWKRRPGNGSV